MSNPISELQAAKDSHYREHPVETPRAQDGTVLALGQHVEINCQYHTPDPVITELTIRCYGVPGTDPIYDRIDFRTRTQIGTRPVQRVWVFVNGQNCIHAPEDVVRVFE